VHPGFAEGNMRKFTWIVQTNCDSAHDQEFNAWYDDIHLGDLLRIPGVVAARRSKLSDSQMTMVDSTLILCDPKTLGAKYRYLALYSIETDDIAAVLAAIKARSGTSEMVISPYLIEASTVMYEDL
jgi:hypothetical protein